MATTRTSALNSSVSAGFTLLEIMVVIVIMGIMLGVAAAYIPNNSQSYLLEQEAKRLNETLRLASQQAVLQGRNYGFSVAQDHYYFMLFDTASGQWNEITEEPFTAYTIPSAVQISLEAQKLTLPDKRAGQSSSPSLLLLSSGQTSAFKLVLQLVDNSRPGIMLSSDGKSDLQQTEMSYAH